MKVNIVNRPNEALGLAVIIDVFRAFSLEPYIINNGANDLIPVGDKEIAYKYKEQNPDYILVGERNGIKLPGFDYGNSPFQIKNVDFTNKTVIHTTSCGTQGIVNAVNADEIITGSFVNSEAIIKYIKNSKFNTVSLVAMARPGEEPFEEDQLLAEYLKTQLEGKNLENLNERKEKLKVTTGAKFFDKELKDVFPEEDYYMCLELNKFDFVLKVVNEGNCRLKMKKIDV